MDAKELEDGEIKLRRPFYRDILRLSEGLVDESPGRSLLLKQKIEGEESESHVAFLTVANVPYEMDFPGEEWLYLIQTYDPGYPSICRVTASSSLTETPFYDDDLSKADNRSTDESERR